MAVERALSKVDGVTGCVVDLAAKEAEITLTHPVEDDVLMAAVNEEGFTAVSVEGR
jgi:copper chaperone CopZ